MTTQKILVQPDGLYLMTCPVKPVGNCTGDCCKGAYCKALAYDRNLYEARKPENIVRFKDQEVTELLLWQQNPESDFYGKSEREFKASLYKFSVGSEHEVPTGYDLVFEKICHQTGLRCGFPCNGEKNCKKIAILKKIEPVATPAISADYSFLLGKKIRYRYCDWETGSYSPWTTCSQRDIEKIFSDNSIESVEFKP